MNHDLPRPCRPGLNAPFGARCFLTEFPGRYGPGPDQRRLNAPFGARWFLTERGGRVPHLGAGSGLNAPFGARCFLTGVRRRGEAARHVLMHFLVLGAF